MLDTLKVMVRFVSLSLFNTYIENRIQRDENKAEAAEIDTISERELNKIELLIGSSDLASIMVQDFQLVPESTFNPNLSSIVSASTIEKMCLQALTAPTYKSGRPNFRSDIF